MSKQQLYYDDVQVGDALPPLIKGYLRLGGFIADGVAVDNQFGTTEVLIIIPVSEIRPRYIRRFRTVENG